MAVLLPFACGLLFACAGNGNPPGHAGTLPPQPERVADQERQGDSASTEPGTQTQTARDSLEDEEPAAQKVDPQIAQAQPREAGPRQQPGVGSVADPTESDVGSFYVAPEDMNVRDWVDSYDYGLPEAEPGDSLSAMSTLTANPLIPQYHLLRVVMTVPLMEDETPFNVTLLLDPGGAMAGEKHASAARLLASRVVEGLRPDRDRVGVVWFPAGGQRPKAIAHRESDLRAVREAIASFPPSDEPDLREALDLAAQTAADTDVQVGSEDQPVS